MSTKGTGMASSSPTYADVATPKVERTTAKPVFIKERDFFSSKPSKDQWITHVELYKAISTHVPAENIAGIQRVRGLWRIYMDDTESRNNLFTCDFALRGKELNVYDTNPAFFRRNIHTGSYVQTVRVRVKNVPLSADDGQIKRALELQKCEIVSMFREKLRIDGKLTNCETGDHIVIVGPIESPLPSSLSIGRYNASIRHQGQINENIKCNRCLETGHSSKDCENDVVCKACHTPGHIMSECPNVELENEESEEAESQSDTGDSEDEATQGDIEQSVTDSVTDSAADSGTPDAAVAPSEANADNTSNIKSASTSKSPKAIKQNKKSGKNEKKHQKQGPITKFLNTTPSRKSTNLTPDTRSPLSPLEERGERPNKRPKDNQ